jgi:hypothetical protein
MTAAGASGVREAFQALFDASEFARQVEVHQSYQSTEEPPDHAIVVEGDISDERRERIRQSLIRTWKAENSDW